MYKNLQTPGLGTYIYIYIYICIMCVRVCVCVCVRVCVCVCVAKVLACSGRTYDDQHRCYDQRKSLVALVHVCWRLTRSLRRLDVMEGCFGNN